MYEVFQLGDEVITLNGVVADRFFQLLGDGFFLVCALVVLLVLILGVLCMIAFRMK